MPPKASLEEDETILETSASASASGSARPTGPGTLRQRFKLKVDDLSKEVEELSVKLKRKVCAPILHRLL